jgi:hypothetical protein
MFSIRPHHPWRRRLSAAFTFNKPIVAGPNCGVPFNDYPVLFKVVIPLVLRRVNQQVVRSPATAGSGHKFLAGNQL